MKFIKNSLLIGLICFTSLDFTECANFKKSIGQGSIEINNQPANLTLDSNDSVTCNMYECREWTKIAIGLIITICVIVITARVNRSN
jgi:hypothetical protein